MAMSSPSTLFFPSQPKSPFSRLRIPSHWLNSRPLASIKTPQNPNFTSHFSLSASESASFSSNFDAEMKSIHYRKSHFVRRRQPSFRVHASKEEAETRTTTTDNIKGQVIVGSAITIVLAVANRVLYKLALVPMKEYPFFLAQVTTFGYVAIYFSFLFMRYCAGVVTNDMLALPKSRFMLIGMLEALGVAAGMSAAAMLPGPAIPILNQVFLIWQLIFSTLILGRKYSFNQIAGCLLVATGVIVAVASGSNEGQMFSNIKLIWPLIMVASSAFQAGASILKEFVFIDAAKRLKGKPLDIFVVNSFGSGFQALFVLLFMPFLSNLKGIPFPELPSYLRSGGACFLNVGANVPGCDGAPLLPLLFISMNMVFNISLLSLVKKSSAVISSLATTLAVPITIFVLALPLPYIPEGTSLSPFFLIGSVVLVLGLVLYNLPGFSKEGSERV